MYFTFDYYASFHFETWSEGISLHLICNVHTDYQMVCVRNFIHPFENVRSLVRNCPKSKIISSENFCLKIKCPHINVQNFLKLMYLASRRVISHRKQKDFLLSK